MPTIFTPITVPVRLPGGQIFYSARVTPAEAYEVLQESNTKNRNMRGKARIDQFVRDMLEGKWVPANGDTIAFDVDGRLANGQHRLFAVVQSGCTIEFLVIENVAIEAQQTIDTGSKRTAGDQLRIANIKNSNGVAAVARFCLHYYKQGYCTTFRNTSWVPNEREIREFVMQNDASLQRVYLAIRQVRPSRWELSGLSLGMIGALYLVVEPSASAEAEEFFIRQLVQGVHLDVNSPARALREYFSNDRKRKVGTYDSWAFLVRGWNAFRKNEPLTVMRQPKVGWHKDNIPRPVL